MKLGDEIHLVQAGNTLSYYPKIYKYTYSSDLTCMEKDKISNISVTQ